MPFVGWAGSPLDVYLKRYIMDVMNGKQVIKELERNGWLVVRINGSHHMLKREGVTVPVPVPVHGSRDLGIGLIKKIEKQTGVKLT